MFVHTDIWYMICSMCMFICANVCAACWVWFRERFRASYTFHRTYVKRSNREPHRLPQSVRGLVFLLLFFLSQWPIEPNTMRPTPVWVIYLHFVYNKYIFYFIFSSLWKISYAISSLKIAETNNNIRASGNMYFISHLRGYMLFICYFPSCQRKTDVNYCFLNIRKYVKQRCQ